MKAPDFPKDMEWINSHAPLRLEQLRGKVVLLDFWTYGCINCMHIIPDLHALERKFGPALVVVGVHSAKFKAEGESVNLRTVVRRLGITHPVLNDKDYQVWQSYGVRAWPTVVCIGPDGNIRAVRSGEGVFNGFAPLIQELVDKATEDGSLDPKPLDLRSYMPMEEPSTLHFPGKVEPVGEQGLVISDTGNHRLVLTELYEGKPMARMREVIGGGEGGFANGPFEQARLFSPQGCAATPDGRYLYVADTGNHSIRCIDLQEKSVETVAGTGSQSTVYPGVAGFGPETALSSPWDVCLVGDMLYIAMAGSHQIWTLDLRTNHVSPWAGTGGEALVDGPLQQSLLAQPSGLSHAEVLGRPYLFFADAEASAVRSVDLEAGEVRTLVGQGLFEFGDADGPMETALLQHPLGVAFSSFDNLLYVADTYNNKIKQVDPNSGVCMGFSGKGRGHIDGRHARYFEPGGLCVRGNTLYIADTNNHAVRVLDLGTGIVDTLQLARS